MRLWSLHPSYLDAKGIVALWREALLAQKVLIGGTKGYKNHPQLVRFKEHKNPEAAIASYLRGVCEEAKARGYNFDESKILRTSLTIPLIKVTDGQVAYEMDHLCNKLKQRDFKKYETVSCITRIKLHPLFEQTKGGIALWEKITA